MSSHPRKFGFLGLVLTLSLLLSLGAAAYAAPANPPLNVFYAPLQFTFGEERLAPPDDQRGFIYQSRTYLPLRFVAYSLKQSVEWDGDTYTVTLAPPSVDELQEIEAYNRANKVGGETEAAEVPTSHTAVQASIRQVTYIIDGKTVVPGEGMEGIFLNQRLFVPLRFVTDSIGIDIDWDQQTYSVAVKTLEAANEDQPAAKPDEPLANVPQNPGAAVPPASGGGFGGGGGGGGGTVTKPSHESLIAEAESKLTTLKSSCENTLTNLKQQYEAATDNEAKLAIIGQGWSAVASCDSQFNTIMGDLEGKLTAGGYATDVIATYRASYEEQKRAAQEQFGR